ncbi:MAG: hypothetical protein ABJB34_12870, partial [Acidobacteriota bacterium]
IIEAVRPAECHLSHLSTSISRSLLSRPKMTETGFGTYASKRKVLLGFEAGSSTSSVEIPDTVTHTAG